MIAFYPEWVELEPCAAILVAVCVEDDSDLVGRETVHSIKQLIAACKNGPHAFRAERVIHPRTDVDRRFIIDESKLGALTRRFSFIGRHLSEVGDRSRRG